LVGRGAKVNVLLRSDDGKLKSPLDCCYDVGVYDTNVPRTSRHWEDLWVARLRAAKFLAARGGRMLIKHSMPIAFRFLLHACSGNWSRLFEEALEQTPEELKSEAYLNALLFRAAKAGSEDVVGLLLDAGAHINTRSATGQTPLHRAALRGHMYTAKVLVQRGADLALRDNKGRTAAIQAFTQKHEGLVEYLMSQGSPKDLPQMVVVPFTAELGDDRTNTTWEETFMATICFLNWPGTDVGEEEEAGLSSWLVGIHREAGGGVSDDSSQDPENWNRQFASLTGRRGEGFYAAWRAAQIRSDAS
jgi:ankyrin repeat protein